MDADLKNNISCFNENDNNFSCEKGWILLGNWAEQKLKSGKNSSFLCEVPPDFRDWGIYSEKYHEPLINFCN